MGLPLATGHLDRAAHLRRDDAWLAEAMLDKRSRLLLVDPPGIAVAGEPPALAWIQLDPLEDPDELLFLGLDGDVAVFAIDRRDVNIIDLKAVGGVLPEGHGSVAAQAIGLVGWHRKHKFCGVCGAPTKVGEAGYLRTCTSCGTQHFPRTDPAVIMLVTHGDRALLGRQASWDAGRYSTLAGFVEPGESLEDAVAREVWEEAGVRLGEVRYHSSQPWPF